MKIILCLLLILYSSTQPIECWAATYYVSTVGNDTTGDGSIGNPWFTVQRAAETMVAGDTTYIRAGTYTESNITFANDGTATNRITLRNYPSESVTIDGAVTSAATPPVFDIDADDYITLQGLTITRGGTAGVRIANNSITVGTWVIECEVTNFRALNNGDNSGEIYIGASSNDTRIIRNVLHGDQNCSNATTNCAGIIIFHPKNIEIRGNNIYDVRGSGIYLKHNSNTGYTVIVRDNYIHDLTNASSTGIKWSGSNGQITNNVIANLGSGTNSTAGVLLFEESATCDSLIVQDNTLSHNTIASTGNGLIVNRSTSCVGAIRTVVQDNIIYDWRRTDHLGLSIHRYVPGRWAASTSYSTGNVRSPSAAQDNGYSYSVSAYLNGCAGPCSSGSVQPTWPTTIGATVDDGDVRWTNDGYTDGSQTTLRNTLIYSTASTKELQIHDLQYDVTSPPSTISGGTGNLQTAPTFLNESTGDYRLALGSAGKGVGSDGGDMGACLVAPVGSWASSCSELFKSFDMWMLGR